MKNQLILFFVEHFVVRLIMINHSADWNRFTRYREKQLCEMYENKVRIECKILYLHTSMKSFWELCTKLRTVLRTLWCIWMMKWWLLWFQSLEASNNAFHGARTKLVSKSIYVYKRQSKSVLPPPKCRRMILAISSQGCLNSSANINVVCADQIYHSRLSIK